MVATYVIGDIHGCFDTLQALWPRLGFDPTQDRLWLVGDLVNRGPKSLEVLRWARTLNERFGERMQVVLGNHDLHLLARHDGWAPQRAKDTLEEVLSAPDREPLMAWLASRPLLYREPGVLLVHAGLLPQWTVEEAEQRAREIEPVLQDPARRRPILERGSAPAEDSLWQPLRDDLSALVSLRTCTAEGTPCKWKGAPDGAPEGCLPWFQVPERRTADTTVVFGHWAAMGLHLEPSVIGLDSGCVWGQQLTALRLEDRTLFQQTSVESR